MNPRIRYGILAAIGCLLLPFLSRLPKGFAWMAEYFPYDSEGALFILIFMAVPAVVVFLAFLCSRGPRFLPGLLATAAVWVSLILFHFNNDVSSTSSAPISMVIIPVYAAVLGTAAGLIGLLIQFIHGRVRPV
jgi:hypothetical protein